MLVLKEERKVDAREMARLEIILMIEDLIEQKTPITAENEVVRGLFEFYLSDTEDVPVETLREFVDGLSYFCAKAQAKIKDEDTLRAKIGCFVENELNIPER